MAALLMVVAPAGAAAAADGPPAYYPSGPQINVDTTALEGWTLCFSGPFNETAPLYGEGGILSELCTGDYLLLTGGPVDSTVLTVLAAAPREDVVFATGDDLETSHAANGSEWYFDANRSWGFAPGGSAVYKFTCDVDGVYDEDRLCYLAEGDHLQQGYRLGVNRLNNSADYSRYIYQPGEAAPAEVPTEISAETPLLPSAGTDASDPLALAGGLVLAGLVAFGFVRRRAAQ